MTIWQVLQFYGNGSFDHETYTPTVLSIKGDPWSPRVLTIKGGSLVAYSVVH